MTARQATAVALAVVFAVGCDYRAIRRTSLGGANSAVRYEVPYAEYELANGLTVVLLPDTRTNLVRVGMRYRVGSVEDPPGKSGLAHLVEHLTYETGAGDGDRLTDRLAEAALSYNAYTTWDETHYYGTGLDTQFDALLAVEARRLAAGCADVEPTVFERERDVVLSEIRERAGPFETVIQRVSEAVYGEEHPYSRTVGGTAAEVRALELDDVCRFIATYYAPERAVLVVSGNFDRAAVARQIQELFGAVPSRTTPPLQAIGQLELDGGSTKIHAKIKQATAYIVSPGKVFADRERAYDRMLSDLLELELYETFAEDEVISGVAVGRFGGRRAPLDVVAISVTDPDKLEVAVTVFFSRRERMFRKLTSWDVGHARQRAASDLIRVLESFASRDSYIGRFAHLGRRLFVNDALDWQIAATVPALHERAARFFDADSTFVVYVYPEKDADALVDKVPIRQTEQVYDVGQWRTKVERAELERDLPLPARAATFESQTFDLGNGLHVVLVPELDAPIFDMRLVLPVGRLHEPAELPGLATAAAEWLQLDLDGNIRDADERFMVKALGRSARVRRAVGEATTTFYATGIHFNLDATLWATDFLVEQGHYDDERLEQERSAWGRTIDEDDRRNARHEAELRKALYGSEHPYAATSIDVELGALTVAELTAFKQRHYGPRGATLIITGRFDAEGAERNIRDVFAAWEDTGAPATTPAVPPAQRASATRYFASYEDDATTVGVSFAFAPSPATGKRRAALDVLRSMLYAEMSALREELAATYGIAVVLLHRRGPGQLTIRGSIDAERGAQAFVRMREIVGAFRAGEGLEDAFIRARRSQLHGLLADMVTSEIVADRLQREATDGPGFQELSRSVASLRLADVEQAIAETLAVDTGIVVLVGPKDAVDAAYAAAGITDFEVLK